MTQVKTRRRYDSSGRREDARRKRLVVLEAAERRFLTDGYAPTTVALIAADAGVSPELVYKTFGGKGGLVQAIFERRLGGTDGVPAYQRSDEMREKHDDPRSIMQEWGVLTAEVAAALTPIRLLLRAAAATDSDLAALLERIEQERLERMRHHAEFLEERGFLRGGVDTDEATDVLWACSSVEFYELMVLQRGWSLPRYAGFITDFMISGLLQRQ